MQKVKRKIEKYKEMFKHLLLSFLLATVFSHGLSVGLILNRRAAGCNSSIVIPINLLFFFGT